VSMFFQKEKLISPEIQGGKQSVLSKLVDINRLDWYRGTSTAQCLQNHVSLDKLNRLNLRSDYEKSKTYTIRCCSQLVFC
jgi:hypothetical protein